MRRITALGLVALGAAFGVALGAGGLALAQITLPPPVGDMQGQTLGVIDLGKAFPQMAGYSLSLRFTTIPPGAGRALHSHREMPEIIHIVSGTLTEQRNGQPPVTLPPGATAIHDETVDHANVNLGKEPVVLYATNVSKTPTPAAR